MGRSSRLCITAAICFIAGFLCSPVVIGAWKARFVAPVKRQQEREAYSFFYKTMLELFEGTYNPENGSISKGDLDIYKEFEDRLGGMCQVRLERDSAGDFVGYAFFPSGDVFEVAVRRIEGSWHLNYFPRNWRQLWASELDRYDLSNIEQHQAP